ncbi:AP-4 complex subunit mu-1-like isoform X2 [Gigantopelta aegis]|uniref:AP-4 complex subunit mu-1-like isoform X2 n=1 Tax=Gigantopelta aegis TaxID=1735272 RepID=UPI001B88CECA|nr:AP-4 complex subunit mu-1-like isoform X2 [Gigantopelta aegis]
MISEIIILSSHLEPLLKKAYRNDVINAKTTQLFQEKLKDEGTTHVPPHFKVGTVFFFYVRRNGLYFVATSTNEMSPVCVIELLSRMYYIFKDFCGVVNEESVRLNILLLLEVLNEILDSGYIQLAVTEKIKPYLTCEPVVMETSKSRQDDVAARLFGIENKNVPSTAANKTVIRSSSDLENRKNEIFVDVVEKLTAVVESNGTPSHLEIIGSVNMKNFVTGSPQINIALNEDLVVNKGQIRGFGHSVQLDHCSFHQCVRLDDFESKKILKVYPPAGEFSVMTYTVSGDIPINLPIRIMTFISDIKDSRDVDLTMRLRCEIPTSCHAVFVTVKFKVPKSVTSISQHLSHPEQYAELNKGDQFILWKTSKLRGGTETTSQFRLISQTGDIINKKELGPVIVDFEISAYLCTGLQIRFLKCSDQDQSHVPCRWVRYITVNDSFTVKL